MENTVSVDDVDHMVCMIEWDSSQQPKYFTIKHTSGLCSVTLKQFNNIALEPIRISYLPINSNISTTAYKLQGSTLNSLVGNSWNFNVQHWAYVVLSRVKRLNSLILNTKLEENRHYKASGELIRWESNIKKIYRRKNIPR